MHEIRGRRHRGNLEDLGKIKEVASQEDHVLESFGDEFSFDNDEANVMACSLALPDNRQAWLKRYNSSQIFATPWGFRCGVMHPPQCERPIAPRNTFSRYE